MSQYYYLNENREPQGPHSLDELSTMMAKGAVSPMTLVARLGGKQWEPLGSLLSREPLAAADVGGPPPPPLPASLGCCPSCGTLLQATEEGNMPQACPKCWREFLPATNSIWSNFKLAMSNYAKFSGRATRAEFWGYQIVMNAIFIVLLLAIIIPLAPLFPPIWEAIQEIGLENLAAMPQAEMEGYLREAVKEAGSFDLPGLSMGIIIIAAICLLVSTFLIIIPSISINFRRMHDRGYSGWWVIAYMGVEACSNVLDELAAKESSFGVLTSLSLLLALGSIAFWIFMLIVWMSDSQRGPNKYGPSSKYPLG